MHTACGSPTASDVPMLGALGDVTSVNVVWTPCAIAAAEWGEADAVDAWVSRSGDTQVDVATLAPSAEAELVAFMGGTRDAAAVSQGDGAWEGGGADDGEVRA